MEVVYPILRFDLGRDAFVVWLRWVAMKSPAGDDASGPDNQGIRIELMLNRNTVLGPTVVFRKDLGEGIYLRANRQQVNAALQAARGRGLLDVQLIIHGSVANAPFAALHHVRDHDREAIDTRPVTHTPLLQLQPSTPPTQWHVAAQCNVRLKLELVGRPASLRVLRGQQIDHGPDPQHGEDQGSELESEEDDDRDR